MQVKPKMREGVVRERRGGLVWAIALAGGILQIFDGAALGADVRKQLGEREVGRIVRGTCVVRACVSAFTQPEHHTAHDSLEEQKIRAVVLDESIEESLMRLSRKIAR